MICSEETRKESPEGTLGVRGNSATTGLTVMRGNSEMTEDTLLRARLLATVREKGRLSLSSVHASPRRSAAEDVGHLRQPSVRDWLAQLQEEDMKSSLRLGLVAHHVVDFRPVESALPWLAV